MLLRPKSVILYTIRPSASGENLAGILGDADADPESLMGREGEG